MPLMRFHDAISLKDGMKTNSALFCPVSKVGDTYAIALTAPAAGLVIVI